MIFERSNSSAKLLMLRVLTVWAGLASLSQPIAYAEIFISEFHYDNEGSDVGEFIELSASTDENLSEYKVLLYNGSTARSYAELPLPKSLTPHPSCGENAGTALITLASNGIQNGSPDGLALVGKENTTIQFLSYEGTIQAQDGPAAGLSSVDVGVQENGDTPLDFSLQLVDGKWQSPQLNTKGQCTTVLNGTFPTPRPSPVPTPQPGNIDKVFISEIHYDNAGADTGESIELTGPIASSLDGWTLLLYNGANGKIYSTINLQGTFPSATPCDGLSSLAFPITGVQNGPDGVALINPNNELAEFISYEGSFLAKEGVAEGVNSLDIGVSESTSTPSGLSLQKLGGIWQGPQQSSFGSCSTVSMPTPTPPPSATIVKIHQIQGDGSDIAITGSVKISGIVTESFQAAHQLKGFFVQEEDREQDSDAKTSEGIFIFCDACPTRVKSGDKVEVAGFANDFFGMSQLTVNKPGDIVVLSEGNALPAAKVIDFNLRGDPGSVQDAQHMRAAFFEPYEGMRLRFSNRLFVDEYFELQRFGQVVLNANGRPRQFTHLQYPNAKGLQRHRANQALEKIILDDGSSVQNLASRNQLALPFPSPGFSTTNFFRGGDSIVGLSGILHFAFSEWRLQASPSSANYTFEASNPRSESPQVHARLKVASFNVLNYFTQLDRGENKCGPNRSLGCRGANTEIELERQSAKIVSALCAIDADIIGLMEVENSPKESELSALAYLTQKINERCPEYQSAHKGPIGSDAIKVGLLYKPNTVSLHGDSVILDSPKFLDPRATGRNRNRPALLQVFVDRASGEQLAVIVNHLKSKGSACGEGDDDPLSGQGNCNATRAAATQFLAKWLKQNYAETHTLILGDLNAYRFEEPIRNLVNQGFTDLAESFIGDDAYSFVFDGQLGYLDYALANHTLLPFITGVEEWHINADEVNALDYNDAVRSAGERSMQVKTSVGPLYAPDPFRSSDHDPVIVGIAFPTPPRCDGERATIWVNLRGRIVGGPYDGQAYRGVLIGTDERDVVVGTSQNDLIFTGRGADKACAGDGDDFIFNPSGSSRLWGEKGSDFIIGSNSADFINGGKGNDIIDGQAGDDLLDGGEGWDVLIGNQGTDSCKNGWPIGCEKKL